jgi:general secretion pathway protein L
MPALSGLLESPAGLAAADAWRWWTGEMRSMVPERFRSAGRTRPTADIRPGRQGVVVDIVKDGVGQRFADSTRLEDLGPQGWEELAALTEGCRIRILLESPDAFVTRVTLPKAARRRLRSAVGLQLSQISPLDPDSVCWAASARDLGPDRIEAEVAMARPERIDQLQDLFEANAIAAPPICASGANGAIQIAPGRRLRSLRANDLLARPGLVAALLIATIPVTTTIGATLLRASAENRIAVLEKGAAPRLEAEARARRSEALRRDLRPLATRPAVSATLEELASRLPLTDHVRSIERGSDRSLVFTVETGNAEAIEAALQGSPLLPGLAVADIVPGPNGKLAVTFRTAAR